MRFSGFSFSLSVVKDPDFVWVEVTLVLVLLSVLIVPQKLERFSEEWY